MRMFGCAMIAPTLSRYADCVETAGGLRVRTTCLYPSFEPVFIFVAKLGDGFRVSDGGEACRVAEAHGQARGAARSKVHQHAQRYGLDFERGAIVAKIDALEWLDSAIVSVANAAASGATDALPDVTSFVEEEIAERLYERLVNYVPKHKIGRDVERRGNSGRKYRFDFEVRSEIISLFDTVIAHPNSVTSRFVAFSDAGQGEDVAGYIVYDGKLKKEDKALLQDVAITLPISGFDAALTAGKIRYLQ